MTKEVLLSGKSRDGLYVLSTSSATSLPQAFSSTCLSTSVDVWHRRLGHPSPRILHLWVKNKKCHVRPLSLIFIILRALWASRHV